MLSTTVRVSEDPRTVRTRQLLVGAFTELLHESGFNAITVQDIAARATVNRATFYAHFDDKYALFTYATRLQFMEMVEKQGLLATSYNPVQLQKLIESVYSFLIQLQQGCARSFWQFQPMVATEVVAGIETVLKKWLTSESTGTLHQNEHEFTINIVGWGIYGVVRNWLKDQPTDSIEQFTRRVVPLIVPIIEQSLKKLK